jgi:conjugal transfer pilus assembly protein TrbC
MAGEIFGLSSLGLLALALAVAVLAGLLWARGLPLPALVLATFAGFGLFSAAAPSLAQTAEELVAKVQSRVADQTPAAQALFDATRDKHEPYLGQAQAIADARPGRLAQGFAALEGGPFADGRAVASLGEAAPKDGVVYIAVSFSMPAADLRRLGHDARKAGAELVIRGLVHGSFKDTLIAARQVFDEDSLGGVAIDPNVFRAFNIQATPTFIAAAKPVEPCGKGLDCIPPAPPHDSLRGNISLNEALRLLKSRGEEAVSAATAASERLGG